MRLKTWSVAASVALCLTLVPPASASTIGQAAVTGVATVTGGLGIPCVHGCPPVAPNPAALTDKRQPEFFVLGGDVRSGAYNTQTCLYTGFTVAKGKPVVETGGCRLAFTFTITGFCNLGHGFGSGTFGAAGQSYSLQFGFTVTGATLALRGNFSKGGKTGVLEARLSWLEDPLDVGSCTTKTGQVFHGEGTVRLSPKVTT